MSRTPSTVKQSQFGPVNNAGRRRARPQPIVLLKGPAQGLSHTSDYNLNQLQQNVATSTRVAKANPLADCNFLQGITMSAGVTQTIQHGLDRAWVSAMVCAQSASGSVAFQRPSTTISRPLSQQNILDMKQVTFTPLFNGVADLLIW